MSTSLRFKLDEEQKGVPLARYTSLRVGGNAERFFIPSTVDHLVTYLNQLPQGTPVTVLGLGSNVLVPDTGIAGAVVLLHKGLNTLTQIAPDTLRVFAGVPCPKIAKYSVSLGLTGGEFLCGIPGTMGGALWMNAGCYGGQTWDLVQRVQVWDAEHGLHDLTPEAFEVSYRAVAGSAGKIFIAADLKFQTGHSTQVIADLLTKRAASQPLGTWNCGSVFKNPEGKFAAQLIEAAGLKGRQVGGAEVSTKHANFIINTGKATAADIMMLIAEVQATVFSYTGVKLDLELCVLGERPHG